MPQLQLQPRTLSLPHPPPPTSRHHPSLGVFRTQRRSTPYWVYSANCTALTALPLIPPPPVGPIPDSLPIRPTTHSLSLPPTTTHLVPRHCTCVGATNIC